MDKCVFKTCNTYNYEGVQYIIVSSINVNSFVLKRNHPNNVVQLKNEKIFQIDMILMKEEHTKDVCKRDFYILSYELADRQETFNYPIASKEVGIVVGSTFLQFYNFTIGKFSQ